MKIVLDIKSPSKTYKKDILLGQKVVMGRNNKAEFIIADDQMSGTHVEISFSKSGLFIKDMGSKNGTFINKMRVETSKFYVGDSVKVGNSSIMINDDEIDAETKNFLSFKGDAKHRTAYGLKLDFESIGKSNPKGPEQIGEKTIVMEMRKSKPRKFSKKELRQKHKAMASFASTLDLFFGFGTIALSLILSYIAVLIIPEILRGHRLTFSFTLVLINFLLFYYYNFKKSSFTIGEKIVGLKSMYHKQN